MQVTFFLSGEERLEALAGLDPERDHAQFRRGPQVWILQTYLRLVRAGYPARLADTPPVDGLVLYHVKQRNDLMRLWRPASKAVLVGIRADNHHSPIADFEILQNDCYARPGRRFFVPHWPQPGIVPRDPQRGSAIRTLAYHGFTNNLDARFLAEPFQQWLAARGIAWLLDSTAFSRQSTAGEQALTWHDYRDIDLILAVRPHERDLHRKKPATKLYNAWLAEVPALLGPEYAYRALRSSDLDYIEVDSPQKAQQAIETLQAQPQLYLDMVANGRQRAQAFTAQRILERWIELLYTTLPALAREPHVRRWQGRPLALKKFVRRFLSFADR